jgi:hypothetical protein
MKTAPENRRKKGVADLVRQVPEEAELAAIRRGNETGLPYGEPR